MAVSAYALLLRPFSPAQLVDPARLPGWNSFVEALASHNLALASIRSLCCYYGTLPYPFDCPADIACPRWLLEKKAFVPYSTDSLDRGNRSISLWIRDSGVCGGVDRLESGIDTDPALRSRGCRKYLESW